MARHRDEPAEERAARVGEIVRRHIPVTAVVLFGSYAKGAEHEWSDLDVAVFTPVAEELSLDRQVDFDLEVHKAVGTDVQIIYLDAQDYPVPRQFSFAEEVLRGGKRVA